MQNLFNQLLHFNSFIEPSIVIILLCIGKLWRGKILVNLVNDAQFITIIFLTNTCIYCEITEDLPSDFIPYHLLCQ